MRVIPTSRGSGQRITTKGFGMGVRLGAAFQALALVILLLALPARGLVSCYKAAGAWFRIPRIV